MNLHDTIRMACTDAQHIINRRYAGAPWACVYDNVVASIANQNPMLDLAATAICHASTYTVTVTEPEKKPEGYNPKFDMDYEWDMKLPYSEKPINLLDLLYCGSTEADETGVWSEIYKVTITVRNADDSVYGVFVIDKNVMEPFLDEDEHPADEAPENIVRALAAITDDHFRRILMDIMDVYTAQMVEAIQCVLDTGNMPGKTFGQVLRPAFKSDMGDKKDE